MGGRAFWGAILATLAAVLATAAAPAGASISVSPVTRELCAKPGDTDAGLWHIVNMGSETVSVAVSAIRYSDYMGGNRDASSPDWFRLNSGDLNLGPGASGTVSYELQVPGDVRGEQMLMVFFAEHSATGGTVQGRIGGAFYIMASGTLEPALAMPTFRSLVDQDGRIRFFLEMTNNGNVHLRPRGEITVVDSAGKVAGSATLASGLPVLTHGRERFTTQPLARRLAPGDYVARWQLNTGELDGRPGPVLTGEAPLRVE